jgi:hypothetical protein
MLGYSARAGSAEAGELRHYYRQVEPHLYYYLPRDGRGRITDGIGRKGRGNGGRLS